MTPQRLFVLGLALCAGAIALVAVVPGDALRAWLAAAFLWSGVPIGSLGFIMMIRLIGGRWGQATLPVLEAGALTLPITVVSFVPVFAGMAVLYPWTHGTVTGFKGGWMAPLPFVARSLILFGGLGGALWALVARRRSAVAIASAGLLFLTPMMSIVLVDWLVSLDPEFHSSGFGLYGLTIQYTVAWMTAVWLLLDRQPEQTPALAALVITLVLVWLYLAFTHYIIIWSGDLASLVGWYKVRSEGGWGAVYGVCGLVEAGVFLVLMLPGPRHRAPWLRAIAAALIISKALEAAWLVLPRAGGITLVPSLLFALAATGIGLVVVSAQVIVLGWRVARRTPA